MGCFSRSRAASLATLLLLLAASVVVLFVSLLFFARPAQAQVADPCAAPANPVVAENCEPGNPKSEWDVSGSGNANIQGFTTDISVNKGQTVQFKVKTTASSYRLDIYRMGYYGGMGARKVGTVTRSTAQTQPNCLTQSSTGLVDCGNWAVSVSWTVPSDAVSGIYFAKAVRTSGAAGASHIFFIVRDDDGGSDLLFQTSDTSWQAYNQYGGNSLYVGSPAGRAYKVSYNRPITTRGTGAEDFVFNSEYPMVRFLERNGYNVSYFTGVDADRRGAEILEHKAFLSVGHDEYWSGPQRANVEAARGAGVHLGFFSGNEVFWKTRWESSIDGSSTDHRTLVCYKETHANATIDPADPPTWTGTWRDPRFSPPADGRRPENALTGQLFMVNDGATTAIKVPAADGKMRFWRNTSIATQSAGATATLTSGTLGYEWDEDVDNGVRPRGAFQLSSTTVANAPVLQDYGSSYGSGTAEHHMTLYRTLSGALVFGAGTVQWPWGLDANHDRGSAAADSRMQQATVNLLADMAVQPGTLQTGLTVATASSDATAPASTITSPANGATVPANSTVTVAGTASDPGGGVVGGVEVSVDDGATWHPASGRASWSYSFRTGGSGAPTIKSRATDDSANLESPSDGVTVTIGSGSTSCPCSIWSDAAVPASPNEPDATAYELGVKFRADSDGFITGIRFYKGNSQNGGTHRGHLWSAGGTQLSEATFTGETSSGWQQVTLPNPVAIQRDTTYVASYTAPNGHYAEDEGFFSSSGIDSGLLHAPSSVDAGGNGVYGSPGSFPTSGYNDSNYWVDVVFQRDAGTDTTPPTVTEISPGNGATGVSAGANVTATFSEPMDAATITGNVELRDPANNVVPATVSYNATSRTATLDPNAALAPSTTYTATVKGGASGVKDLAGNALSTDRTWSFTTAAQQPSCPCSIWPSSPTPQQPADPDTAAVQLGVKFRSEVAGQITAIRFYKSSANTGTHVGSLWTSTGTRLASATFQNETGSGWQQVNFTTPVLISANTTYVAAYHAPSGRYAADEGFFAGAGVDASPLHALPSALNDGNGVYAYGTSSTFPNSSYQATNYWVDVVFTT